MSAASSRRKAGSSQKASLAQVRALAHPLRLKLFELFALAPRTTKQAAEAMGQPPTRLYHHVATLERAGLVRLKSTRANRGAIEKHYEAVAPLFRIDRTMFGAGSEPLARLVAPGRGGAPTLAAGLEAGHPQARDMAALVFREAEAELQAALAADRGGSAMAAEALAVRVVLHAAPAEVTRLRRDVMAALERLKRSGARRSGRTRTDRAAEQRWTFTLALVPAPEPPGSPEPPRARPAARASRGRTSRARG